MWRDAEFALCLTHDVDRPQKRLAHAVYYAVRDCRPKSLLNQLSDGDPYFQFETLMKLEENLGVRSAFYFLHQPPIYAKGPNAWLRRRNWLEHLGRYDVTADRIADAIRALDDGGWEVGLHGSLYAYRNQDRLAHEKSVLENIMEKPVRGGRQHYLRTDVPETWRDHSAVGLQYDASLGSSTTYGFQHGYGVRRPFDDAFVVFPLTLMEVALPNPGDRFDAAWSVCEDLLREAADNGAVMTVLWHLRYFSEAEFPGYRRLYRRLVERAVELGGWVGPPGRLYDRIEQDPHSFANTPN